MFRAGIFLTATIFLFVAFLLNAYVFQGIQTLIDASTVGGAVVTTLYWITAAILNVGFLWSLARGRRDGKFTGWGRILIHASFIIFITELVFLGVLLAEDVYRVGIALINDLHMPSRSPVVTQLAIFLSGIPFFSLVYGVTKGKHDYKVHRHVISFPDLPEEFDGITVTQISDVHAGSFRNRNAVSRGIDLINAQKSDIFVFTGDLVNNKAEEIEPWVDLFSEIKAPLGKFAVLGNHDYGDYVRWSSVAAKRENLDRLIRHHAALGHRLLLDDYAILEKNGAKIAIAGVENWGKGFSTRGDLESAVGVLPADMFKILLSHDPSHWDAEVKHHPSNIQLTLSGHTHGMQFGIEIPGLKWSPVKYRYPNWAGLAKWENKFLHVNRGFGFLGFEGRVGIWPEITVLELRRRAKPLED